MSQQNFLVLTLKGKFTEFTVKTFMSDFVQSKEGAKELAKGYSATRALFTENEQAYFAKFMGKGFKVSRLVLVCIAEDRVKSFFDITNRTFKTTEAFEYRQIPYLCCVEPKDAKDKDPNEGEGKGKKSGQTASKGSLKRAARREESGSSEPKAERTAKVISPKTFASKAMSVQMPLTVAALARMVGGAPLRVITERKRVNVPELLLALETGTDPRPALECNTYQPKATILAVCDVSGSCIGFQPYMKGICQALANAKSDLEVRYAEYGNGNPVQEDLKGVDMVVYFGDSDIFYQGNIESYGEGLPIFVISNECHNFGTPRIGKTPYSNVVYITGVTPGSDIDNALAVNLAAKQLFSM